MNIDSSLVALLTQKKNSIKSFSIKGVELTCSKSMKTDSNVTCDTLICNNIEIDDSAPTIINNAQINKSIINSTSIGLKKASKGKFTKLEINTQTTSDKLELFKLNGDIQVNDTAGLISNFPTRGLYSVNPYIIKSSQNLLLKSSTYLNLFSNKGFNFNTTNGVMEFMSNKININTTNFDLNSQINILNTTDSNKTTGSTIFNGGILVKKNINVLGNINIEKDLNVQNNLTVGNSTRIGKDIEIEGTLKLGGGSNFQDIIISGIIDSSNSDDSVNINSGAIKTTGGIGLSKNLNVGGVTTIHNTIDSHNLNNASLIVKGGSSIHKNLNVYGNINIFGIGEESLRVYGNSIIDNNLYVKNNLKVGNNTIIGKDIEIEGTIKMGGGGTFKNINMTGILNIDNTIDSTNINNGSIVTNGGMGVIKNLNIGGHTIAHNTTDSTNINNGSIVTNGGMGVIKNLNIGGQTIIHNITDSTNINNGSFVTNGGMSIAKNLNIGGHTIAHNTIDSTNINNGSIVTNGGMGIAKNLNVGGHTKLYSTDEIALNINGGMFVKKNINSESFIIANNANILYNIISNNIFSNTLVVKEDLFIEKKFSAKISNPTSPDEYDNLDGCLNITPDLLIPNAIYKIDNWINKNLIDTPPQPINVNSFINSYSINLQWTNPLQIFVGFLNKKLPDITSICFDYKLVSQAWNESITINTNVTNITNIIAYGFNNKNYISSNTYHLFNLQINTPYDFRIYCINSITNQTNRLTKYLYYYNKQINISSTPEIPSNINVQLNNNNPTNMLDIFWDHPNSNSYNIINTYNINYSTVESIKYPNYIISNLYKKNITPNSISIQPNNYIVLTDLYPGHKYNIQIKAQNLTNNNFSSYSNIVSLQTDYPISPNYINSNNLYIQNNTNYKFNSKYGYSLDGNTFIKNLFNYNLLDNLFKTNIITNIRINENISTTQLKTSILSTDFNNYKSILNLNGFGHTNTSTNIQNNVNIIISNEKDYYTGINSGFYKTNDIQLSFDNPKSYLKPTFNNYNLQLKQNLPFSNVIKTTENYDFYIDKLDNVCTISDINIPSFESYNNKYISGIPTFISSNINFNFISHNLTNNFIRQDKKYFDIFLCDSLQNIYAPNLNISHNTFVNSNHYYYNINGTKHNTTGKIILPNTNSLLFNDLYILLPNNNKGYTENLNIGFYGYNLLGKSNLYKSINQKIRLDYNSFNVIYNTNNSNSILGEQVHSGIDEYPNNPSNNNHEFGFSYNHNLNILNTNELQLVNGVFATPYNNNTFLDYSNYYYNQYLNYPNYSTVLQNNSKRYVTFKYTNIINDTNKITLELINCNFTSVIQNNISLHIKIYNSSNTYHNTAWLNANKYINIIGISEINKNIDNTPCLSYNNYTSTITKKYCYLPIGSTGNLYVRLGINSNVDLSLSYIKVNTGFI